MPWKGSLSTRGRQHIVLIVFIHVWQCSNTCSRTERTERCPHGVILRRLHLELLGEGWWRCCCFVGIVSIVIPISYSRPIWEDLHIHILEIDFGHVIHICQMECEQKCYSLHLSKKPWKESPGLIVLFLLLQECFVSGRGFSFSLDVRIKKIHGKGLPPTWRSVSNNFVIWFGGSYLIWG